MRNSRIRGLTLWQPWASLVAVGAKNYETRSWKTNYRGALAIHAAERKPQRFTGGFETAMRRGFGLDRVILESLPLGAIVATCMLTDCFPVEELWTQLNDLGDEQYFGDYSEGRFAWALSDIRLLDPVVPFSGSQGLWYVPRHRETDLKKLSYP